MKTIKNISVLALALGLAGAAQAAVSPADLTVNGKVKTPVCVVTADNTGIYQYGMMSLDILPTSGHHELPRKKQNLTVDCGAATTYVSYRITDGRDGTASGNGSGSERVFGLGQMPGRGTSKIGYYEIWASNAQVDGNPSYHGVYNPSRQQIYGDSINSVRPRVGNGHDEVVNSWTKYTGWASGSSAMQAGSRFSIDLEVRPFLASKTVVGGGQAVTEQVNMDGLAPVTFAFGL